MGIFRGVVGEVTAPVPYFGDEAAGKGGMLPVKGTVTGGFVVRPALTTDSCFY